MALEERNGGFLVCVQGGGLGLVPRDAGDSPPGHPGLASMREHAQMVGGWLRISNALGAGTTLAFRVPAHEEGITDAEARQLVSTTATVDSRAGWRYGRGSAIVATEGEMDERLSYH